METVRLLLCRHDSGGQKTAEPIGEWNQGRVVAKGNKVTHYLNGKKTVSYDRSSEAYKKIWEMSKYKKSKPMFGSVKQGHILLQDHADEGFFQKYQDSESVKIIIIFVAI